MALTRTRDPNRHLAAQSSIARPLPSHAQYRVPLFSPLHISDTPSAHRRECVAISEGKKGREVSVLWVCSCSSLSVLLKKKRGLKKQTEKKYKSKSKYTIFKNYSTSVPVMIDRKHSTHVAISMCAHNNKRKTQTKKTQLRL